MGPSTSLVWTKVAVASHTTTPIKFSSQLMAAILGPIRTPALPSQARAYVLRVTLPGSLALTAATGGTKVGVSRQHLTMWFTWSTRSTALAVTRATCITFALATA